MNSPVGVAFKLDIEKSIAKVLAMVGEVDPMAAQQMTEGLGGVGAQLGFNLRKDVLESLGVTAHRRHKRLLNDAEGRKGAKSRLMPTAAKVERIDTERVMM